METVLVGHAHHIGAGTHLRDIGRVLGSGAQRDHVGGALVGEGHGREDAAGGRRGRRGGGVVRDQLVPLVGQLGIVAVGVGCLDGQGQSRVAQGVGGRLGLQGDHRRHGVDDRDGHRVGIGGKAGAVGHAHQVGVSARLVGARREGVTGAHGGQGAVGRLLEPLVGERVVAALDAVLLGGLDGQGLGLFARFVGGVGGSRRDLGGDERRGVGQRGREVAVEAEVAGCEGLGLVALEVFAQLGAELVGLLVHLVRDRVEGLVGQLGTVGLGRRLHETVHRGLLGVDLLLQGLEVGRHTVAAGGAVVVGERVDVHEDIAHDVVVGVGHGLSHAL